MRLRSRDLLVLFRLFLTCLLTSISAFSTPATNLGIIPSPKNPVYDIQGLSPLSLDINPAAIDRRDTGRVGRTVLDALNDLQWGGARYPAYAGLNMAASADDANLEGLASPAGIALARRLRGILEEVEFDRTNAALRPQQPRNDSGYATRPFPLEDEPAHRFTPDQAVHYPIVGPGVTRRHYLALMFLMHGYPLHPSELQYVFGAERDALVGSGLEVGLFRQLPDGRIRTNGLSLASREVDGHVIYVFSDTPPEFEQHERAERVYLGPDSYSLMDKIVELPKRGGLATEVGTGTGIQLIFSALRDPALEAVGLEIERRAVNVSRFNLALNGVDDRVQIAATPDAYHALIRGRKASFAVENPPFLPVPGLVRIPAADLSFWSGITGVTLDAEHQLVIDLRSIFGVPGWGGPTGLAVTSEFLRILSPVIGDDTILLIYSSFMADGSGNLLIGALLGAMGAVRMQYENIPGQTTEATNVTMFVPRGLVKQHPEWLRNFTREELQLRLSNLIPGIEKAYEDAGAAIFTTGWIAVTRWARPAPPPHDLALRLPRDAEADLAEAVAWAQLVRRSIADGRIQEVPSERFSFAKRLETYHADIQRQAGFPIVDASALHEENAHPPLVAGSVGGDAVAIDLLTFSRLRKATQRFILDEVRVQRGLPRQDGTWTECVARYGGRAADLLTDVANGIQNGYIAEDPETDLLSTDHNAPKTILRRSIATDWTTADGAPISLSGNLIYSRVKFKPTQGAVTDQLRNSPVPPAHHWGKSIFAKPHEEQIADFEADLTIDGRHEHRRYIVIPNRFPGTYGSLVMIAAAPEPRVQEADAFDVASGMAFLDEGHEDWVIWGNGWGGGASVNDYHWQTTPRMSPRTGFEAMPALRVPTQPLPYDLGPVAVSLQPLLLTRSAMAADPRYAVQFRGQERAAIAREMIALMTRLEQHGIPFGYGLWRDGSDIRGAVCMLNKEDPLGRPYIAMITALGRYEFGDEASYAMDAAALNRNLQAGFLSWSEASPLINAHFQQRQTHYHPSVQNGSVATENMSDPFDQAFAFLESLVDKREAIAADIAAILPERAYKARGIPDNVAPLEHLKQLTQQLDVLFRKHGAANMRIMRAFQESRQALGFQLMDEYPSVDESMLLRGLCYYLADTHKRIREEDRQRQAQALLAFSLTHELALLSVRIWQDPARIPYRLAQVERLLNRINKTSRGKAPVFIRDVHWLTMAAVSLPMKTHTPYLDWYQKIAALPDATMRRSFRIAHAKLIGGHLRANAYNNAYFKNKTPDASDFETLRSGNMIDFSLLITDLSYLLEDYRNAVETKDDDLRKELAEAIFEGLTGDPWLFLGNPAWLRPYVIHENIHMHVIDGKAELNAAGKKMAERLAVFQEILQSLAPELAADARGFKPEAERFSPFGVVYTFFDWLWRGVGIQALLRGGFDSFVLEDAYSIHAPDNALAWAHTFSDEIQWGFAPYKQKDQLRYSQAFADFVYDETYTRLQRYAQQDHASPSNRLYMIHGPNKPGRWLKVPQALSASPTFSWIMRWAAHPIFWRTEKKTLDYALSNPLAFEPEIRDQSLLLDFIDEGGQAYGTPKQEVISALLSGTNPVIAGISATTASMIRLVLPHAVSIFIEEIQDAASEASLIIAELHRLHSSNVILRETA